MDAVVLGATVLERVAVRDLFIGLDGQVLRPFWTSSSVDAAQSRLARSRLRGGLGDAQAASRITAPLRTGNSFLDANVVDSARMGLGADLPADPEFADVEAAAIVVGAKTVLTFRMPPLRYRSLTVPASGGGTRNLAFEDPDEYLTGLFDLLPGDDKLKILQRVYLQAARFRSDLASATGRQIGALLSVLARQGLHAFVRRVKPEFRSKAN